MTYRLDHVMDQLFGLVNLLLGFCHNQTVEVFFLVAGVSGIRAAFAFFDRAFATDGDLGTRLILHLLERVTTRPNK